MRRIIIKETRPGMSLGRTVFHPQEPGTAIITAGETLAVSHIVKLHELGVYDLWVHDPGLGFFDNICSPQSSAAQQRLVEALRNSFLKLPAGSTRAFIRRYEVTLGELIHAVVRGAPAIPCFAAMAEDPTLLQHASDVCTLSMLLGLKLDGYLVEQRRRLDCRHARDISNLALGSLFHDVGELMLPAHQRESQCHAQPGRPEMAGGVIGEEEWKQHTDEGFAAVKGRLDPTAAAIVQHHHQHFDGSGFAGAGSAKAVQKGTAIHVYSRLAMAADLFFHAHAGGGGGVAQPMVQTLWQLQQSPVRGWFDPVVLDALLGLATPFEEGMVVTLSDGRHAIVTKVDASAPCYPHVWAAPEHGTANAEPVATGTSIDLAKTPNIHIAMVDGRSVADFLYGVRQSQSLAA